MWGQKEGRMRDKKKYLCAICSEKKVCSKGSLCSACGRVVRDVLQNEAREMVREIATATESVIENLESGVVYYDSETSKVLTDPAEIVTAIMEDRLIFHPPMSEMVKEHPHLAYQM
jgi:hypothetical protein